MPTAAQATHALSAPRPHRAYVLTLNGSDLPNMLRPVALDTLTASGMDRPAALDLLQRADDLNGSDLAAWA